MGGARGQGLAPASQVQNRPHSPSKDPGTASHAFRSPQEKRCCGSSCKLKLSKSRRKVLARSGGLGFQEVRKCASQKLKIEPETRKQALRSPIQAATTDEPDSGRDRQSSPARPCCPTCTNKALGTRTPMSHNHSADAAKQKWQETCCSASGAGRGSPLCLNFSPQDPRRRGCW